MATNKVNILIVGAGDVGAALLSLLSGSSFANIIGLAEKNENLPSLKFARDKNIPFSTDFHVFLDNKALDKIVNTVSSKEVMEDLTRSKAKNVELLNVNKGSFIWSLINENVWAQAKYRENEERYRMLFDNAADSIAVVDIVGRFVDVNKKFEEESEYSREEVLGKNVLTSGIVTFASAARIGLQLARIRMGESVQLYDIDGVKKSGGTESYELKAVPVYKDGKVVGAQAILRNVSERRQIAERLRQSELRYRTIFENTGTAMLIVKEDMTAEMVNAEFVRLSGYAKEDVEGKKKFTDFIHEQDVDKIREMHWLRSVDPETAPDNYEFRLVDSKGRASDVIMTAALVPGTKNMVMAMQDITELKRNEYQLQKQKELLDNANKVLEHKLCELEEAAGHIKNLEGLVPICANCKRMRVQGKDPKDMASWVPLEKYLSDRTDASFTHGLCPECIRKLYGSQLGNK